MPRQTKKKRKYQKHPELKRFDTTTKRGRQLYMKHYQRKRLKIPKSRHGKRGPKGRGKKKGRR